ncbi:MAG: hypothetical protein JWP89_6962 [Schlesneria sp.]|nr:hypothetical protein [Schlesneria sp.]
MRFDPFVLGAIVPSDNALVIAALALFIGTFLYLLSMQMAVSPQGVSLIVFIASSVFVLWPILLHSSNRDYVLSGPCQWLVLGIAVTWAIAIIGFMTKPSEEVEYPELRTRFIPQQMWLSLLTVVCTIDPIVTVAKFGKIGLMYSNEMVGNGGGYGDVWSITTTLGVVCGMVASAMLQADFLVSRLDWRQFLFGRKKWLDLGLVTWCLCCNSATGNRFVIVMNVVALASGLAIFNRLQVKMALLGLVALTAFFIAIGNYRFGRLEIKNLLSFETNIKVVDSGLGWIASYSEPIFPTLDTYLANAPPPALGGFWLNAVAPTALRGIITGKDRTTAMDEMSQLLPHFGMTFRTMYAELAFDFGLVGSLLVGTVVLLLSIWLYNNATASPFLLSIYIATFHMFGFMALLANFYTQIPFMAVALLWIVVAPSDLESEP